MTELRSLADANIFTARFDVFEDLTAPTEEPDAHNPNPNHSKFGDFEDLTDVPREQDDSETVDLINRDRNVDENETTRTLNPVEIVRTIDSSGPVATAGIVDIIDALGTPEVIKAVNSFISTIDKIATGTPTEIQWGTEGDDGLKGKYLNQPNHISALGGSDDVYGGYDNDVIFGGGGADKLKGLNGDDLLYGGAGKDSLYGGGGSDWLQGNSDNDILIGHTNDEGQYDPYEVDTLIGGLGADTFSLVMNGGPDLYVKVPYLDGLNEHAYAIIRDFNKAEGDAILMGGKKQDYEFVSGDGYGNKLIQDTKIFYQGDMIAVVADTIAADLTLSFV